MFKHTMVLTYLNLKTSASFEETFTHSSDDELVYLDKDVLGNELIHFDFKNDSWLYFKGILESIKDKFGEGLALKVERAINRRVRGTSAGIQVVYRDENNLVWHVIVKFIETKEVSNNF